MSLYGRALFIIHFELRRTRIFTFFHEIFFDTWSVTFLDF